MVVGEPSPPEQGTGGADAGQVDDDGGTANVGGADDLLDEELPAAEPEGVIPSQAYPESLIDLPRENWADGLISPTLESEHHNQPAIINGYLQLTGNARFSIYDISDPTQPEQLEVEESEDNNGEAEGHQVSFAKYGDTFYTATISGRGIDLWDITDARSVEHVKSVHLEGIDYGDFTDAVWGVYWQGTTIYAGGTNTGLHVVDATDPANATVVDRVPTSSLGNVSAGPVYAIGNVLVVTTPKQSGGIATLDISDPHSPLILDALNTSSSYIGALYGHHVYLQGPLRAWDVLSDPTDIGDGDSPVGSLSTPSSEYMSFADGKMFLGLLRPNPGALKIDVTDPLNMTAENRIWGRMDLDGNDDQFTVAAGNLLVMSDDQSSGNGYVGTVIGVHAADPDTTPPSVDTIIPRDGSTGQAITSRIGISFTDNVELATVDTRSFVVRPVGGEALSGTFGVYMGVLNFDPDEDLMPGTTYEVILPAGGIKDYVGNGLDTEFRATFTTQ